MASPVTDHVAQGVNGRGTLLLADISGYTGFLQGVADAHRNLIVVDDPPAAYSLMSSLLDVVVTAIAPRFQLAKFEGDAVFAVAPDPDLELRGGDVLACLRSCYAAFTTRLGEANSLWTCTCGSCSRVHELGLKFVLHHGSYVVQRIAGREELLGPDVNVAHRLLKNHVRDVIGARPYALLTDAVVRALDVPPAEMVTTTETYEHMPPVRAHILPLD
jgi:Protein of unknown function (DUF2652)